MTTLATPALIRLQPYLFVDVQHGLGNRLRALASAAVIAQRTDRKLVVVWVPDHHCEARIGDVLNYEGPVIETRDADLLRARCELTYNYIEIEDGAVFEEPVLPAPEAVQGDVFVRSAYSLVSGWTDMEAEDRVLRALRPNAAVQDMINSVAHPSDVAVHIRISTGPEFDHLSYESPENWPAERHLELLEWRKKSDISRFVTRLDQLFKEEKIKTAFVAADLSATYAALIDRYGDRIRYLPRLGNCRSASQIQTGISGHDTSDSGPVVSGQHLELVFGCGAAPCAAGPQVRKERDRVLRKASENPFNDNSSFLKPMVAFDD